MYVDLDQYYTPNHIAEKILSSTSIRKPKICVDTTCGSGSLLSAANRVFGKIQSVGIDRDKNTIAALKRKNPNWILSVADMLNPISFKRTNALKLELDCDLLVLNPPFSHGYRKSVTIGYRNEQIKCSIAMAHILHSFELFKPNQGAIIIVPESVLYSETDLHARSELRSNYEVKNIMELESCTFKGTRARATVVSILSKPKKARLKVSPDLFLGNEATPLNLVRGGLPVHEAKEDRNGLPYIHTTDLVGLSKNKHMELLKVNQIGRGVTKGWVILFPRVGTPIKSSLTSLYLNKSTQLSDCVIALEFSNKNTAQKSVNKILNNWVSFENLYRGTGARYVTLSRLSDWARKLNIVS